MRKPHIADHSKQVTRGAKGASLRPGGIGLAPPGEKLKGVRVMSWNTPIVIEVCAGMEVTAYLSAQM
jgi:coenzyme PQQ precursor peptide PqqA